MSRPSGTRAAATIPTRCARRIVAAAAGADGITAHLREDRRHITDDDIDRLMAEIDLPLNLEMAATEEMLAIALAPPPARRLHRPRKARGADHRGRARRRRPAQSPALIMSTGCGDAEHPRQPVHRAGDRRRSRPRSASARRSSSSTPAATPISRARSAPPSCKRIADCAALAAKNGIEPHAGHGLTFDNVAPIAAIPQLAELNIGHFLVGEAIFTGLEASVRRMRAADGRGAMIVGIGSDLCNIERIEKSLDRFGDRFLNRVFTETERAKAASRPHTIAGTLAKRFAAKEAFSKAVGTGFKRGVFMKDIGVVNAPSGAPTLRADRRRARRGLTPLRRRATPSTSI